MIGFGFWGAVPIGFDLGQLVLGKIRLGERLAATASELDDACLTGYALGLQAEGRTVSLPRVWTTETR
jgi:hypothetical protein